MPTSYIVGLYEAIAITSILFDLPVPRSSRSQRDPGKLFSSSGGESRTLSRLRMVVPDLHSWTVEGIFQGSPQSHQHVFWTGHRAAGLGGELWMSEIVAPLFTKGDQSLCSNYMGITILSIPVKLCQRGVYFRFKRNSGVLSWLCNPAPCTGVG